MKGINLVLFIGVIMLILALPVTLAICGVIPKIVYNPEHDGYCKMTYGNNFKYNQEKNYCSDGLEQRYFSEEEFKQTCPNHKLLNGGFYSDCFKASESIN